LGNLEGVCLLGPLREEEEEEEEEKKKKKIHIYVHFSRTQRTLTH
jgi:hypothetical protein